MSRTSVAVCLLLVAHLSGVLGFSSGPPAVSNRALVCNQMTPNPTNHGAPQSGDGGYQLDISPAMTEIANGFTYVADTVYTIRIVGGTISGFLVQARAPGNDPPAVPMFIGSFTAGTSQQNLDCEDATGLTPATISHSSNLGGVSSVQFTWTAPSAAGSVNFFYTVVQVRFTHYDALSARSVGVIFPTTPPPAMATTMNTGTTMMPTTMVGDTGATTMMSTTMDPMTTAAPGNLATPQRSPDVYRLRLFNPDGCTRGNCDLFIGIDTNTGDSGFLDIYMEGNAEGWLAVGFSDSSNMFNSDVVACNRVGGDIQALDAWIGGGRGIQTDTTQDVTLHESNFNNGRISCTVSKRVAPTDAQDFDLTGDLFVIFGRRTGTSNDLNVLPSHSGGPDGVAVRGFSTERFVASTSTGAIGGSEFETIHRRRLTQAHGILMIIAWPLLAVTAIFFAAFMKPALPNGQWFQVHRAFLIASLFIGAAAFVLIFVALMGSGGRVDFSSGSSTVHFIFGLIIMAIQIVNPIIAIFRCGPKDKNRWIYNMFHGYILGYLASGLSFANVAIGVSIFFNTFSRFGPLNLWWIVVSYDIFYFVFIIGLVIILVVAYYFYKDQDGGCGSCEKPSQPQGIELDVVAVTEKPAPEEKKDEPKKPSKDSPIRWIALAIYLVITVPLFLAVIVLIALPQ